MRKQKVTIFWIPTFVPTQHELAFAESIGSNVRFRNKRLYGGEAAEECDAVTGCWPEVYDEAKCEKIAYDADGDAAEPETTKPKTKAELEKALRELDVEFPPGLKLKDLLALYAKHDPTA